MTVGYSYAPAGNVTNITAHGVTNKCTFDTAERISSIRNITKNKNNLFTFSYNTNNGLLTQVTCTNNSLTAVYEYDIMDRVTNIVWVIGSNHVSEVVVKKIVSEGGY